MSSRVSLAIALVSLITVSSATVVAARPMPDMRPQPLIARKAYIVGSHSDFAGEAASMLKGAPKRGYATEHVKTGALQRLNEVANVATPRDQILLSLQCHGSAPDVGPDMSRAQMAQHGCCVDQHCREWITAGDLETLARKIRGRGAKLVVMDNSCNGGATVQLLQDVPGVCAIATTGYWSPSLVGFPNFGAALETRRELRTFQDLARWGTYEAVQHLHGRMHQTAYTSGCGAKFMKLRIHFWAEAMSLGGWDMQGVNFYGKAFPGRANGSTPLKDYLERSRRFAFLMEKEWVMAERELNAWIGDLRYERPFSQVFGEFVREYTKRNVPLPLAPHARLRDLVNELRNTVSDNATFRGEFEDAWTALEYATGPQAQSLSATIQGLDKRMWDNNMKLTRILSIIEAINCRTAPSICHRIAI